jgi:hypothetical protein
LGLLSLRRDILDFIRTLPPGTPERLVTEKKLRALTRLPTSEQLVGAGRTLPGFTASQVALNTPDVEARLRRVASCLRR